MLLYTFAHYFGFVDQQYWMSAQNLTAHFPITHSLENTMFYVHLHSNQPHVLGLKCSVFNLFESPECRAVVITSEIIRSKISQQIPKHYIPSQKTFEWMEFLFKIVIVYVFMFYFP